MGGKGFEPLSPFGHTVLSRTRLPIPPPAHLYVFYYIWRFFTIKLIGFQLTRKFAKIILMARKKGIETISTNRKAFHEYFILESFEAGLELLGSEIKSLRLKDCSLEASFVKLENNQAYIFNMHIKPYSFNTHTAVDPTRTRRLLLHRKEINKLTAAKEIKGQTVIPLELYLKNGWAKLKIALAKGKKLYDKRETLKKKDLSREMERGFRNKFRI